MKISIVTVTFNSENTILDTINSVYNQTYADIELIIVDGKSTDKTIDIVKQNVPKFNGRLKYISESDKGIYDAMNKGILISTGDVVGILNSDDVFEDDDVVEDIVTVFTKDKVNAVYGNLKFVKPSDLNQVVRTWIGSQFMLGSFRKGWHPAHPTFYVQKEIYNRYGLYDVNFDVSSDFELMLRFLEKERIKSSYLDRFFVKMRIGGESTGSFLKIFIGNRNVIKAFKKNGIKVSILYPFFRLIPKFINVVKSRM